MNPYACMLAITAAGAVGGLANAFLGDGLIWPRWHRGVWCPGAVATIFLGAVSALGSWALYGAGAAIDLANVNQNTEISLRLSALVGAVIVGAGGARWLSNETDKKLLKESVKVAGTKTLTPKECEELVQGSPREILTAVSTAR